MIELQSYRHLNDLADVLLRVWPAHQSFMTKSFSDRSAEVLTTSDTMAALILALSKTMPEGLDQLCSDYQFLCDKIILPEELHFRRNGRYRLSTMQEAEREVYANPEFMKRYMNGLLVSQVMWSNHAHAMDAYVNRHLPSLPADADHLEVGPGHGLLLYFAAMRPEVASVAGWDVSPTSIKSTERALSALQVKRPLTLVVQNLFEQPNDASVKRYDSIVLSEVLEHVEDPVAALRAVKRWLKPGGRVWVNVPANSPAPDHLFLVNSLDHACSLVADAGFEIENSAAFPMTGTTLEKATRRKLAISCVVTGRHLG